MAKTSWWVLGLVMLGAVLVDVGPAHAERITGVDQSGDVRRYDFAEAGSDVVTSTAAPRRRSIDLTRYSVRYGPKQIRIVMRFRDLDRHHAVLAVQGRLRWPTDGQLAYGEATVTASRARPAGRARSSFGRGCQVRHSLSYRRDLVSIVLPAACIGSPRWIQVNPAAFAYNRPRNPRYVVHDALFPVYESHEGSVERFGPRVRRG